MESIRTQPLARLAITILVLLCSVNAVQSLRCYTCTYSGSGTDTQSCLNPTSSITPIYVCTSNFAVCTKSLASNRGITTVARSCVPTYPSLECETETENSATATVCFCNTDLCNDGPTVHVRTGLRQLLITTALMAASVLLSRW